MQYVAETFVLQATSRSLQCEYLTLQIMRCLGVLDVGLA
jgi:hypothetical protein